MPDPADGVYALEDWSNRWREGRAGWHLEGVHKMLEKYFLLRIVDGRTDLRIFVPLCGKARDLKWMFDQGLCGCHVLLCESNKVGMKQFKAFISLKADALKRQVHQNV